jgi:CheY-like chemotaxis protein
MTLSNGKDVLIIDDDAAVRGLLCAALERLGLTCDTADDGVAALERAAATHHSVILVDLMMPKMDGSAFVTALRERERLSRERPVVLMMTAFPAEDHVPDLGEKVQAVVQKPFDVIELAEIVRDCVAGKRAHESRRRVVAPESRPESRAPH